VEALFEGLDGVLGLHLVALEAFVGFLAAAHSGFGLFLGVSFSEGQVSSVKAPGFTQLP
jgi:hypothetical protein